MLFTKMCGCVVPRKSTPYRSESIINETEQKMKLGSVEGLSDPTADFVIAPEKYPSTMDPSYGLLKLQFASPRSIDFIEIGHCVLGASRYDS